MLDINENKGVSIIRMNRPEKRNALNRSLVTSLTEHFIRLNSDSKTRVIVLTGVDQVFSAGADLDALNALQSATHQENMEDSDALASLFKAMYLCNKPVIGAINGHAIAGGCGLVTLCDISIADENAKFGYTETRIGFVPAMVTKFLISKIGDARARRLLLSGELISANEAQKIGLITEVTSDLPNGLQNRVDYWVELFSEKVSPQAVAATKDLIRNTANLSWSDALDYASKANAEARSTDDCKRGVEAFLKKEKIKW